MSKEITLTQGKVAIVDDSDYEYLSQFKWFAHFDGANWYARRNTRHANGKRSAIIMHRAIMDAPAGLEVDHIDGDGLNNQRSNLRLTTHQRNTLNQRVRRNNTSGYKGVSWHEHTQRWQARIASDGALLHLGIFDTPEEAAVAYNNAALEYHGEYARLNNVDLWDMTL